MLAVPANPTWEASTIIGPFLSGIAVATAYAAQWGPAAAGQSSILPGLVTAGMLGVILESSVEKKGGPDEGGLDVD